MAVLVSSLKDTWGARNAPKVFTYLDKPLKSQQMRPPLRAHHHDPTLQLTGSATCRGRCGVLAAAFRRLEVRDADIFFRFAMLDEIVEAKDQSCG
jgi:hypothetical protein